MLALPPVDRAEYESPPLATMIGQVRFAPILRIGEMAFVAPFQEELRDEYPEWGQQNQVEISVSPTGAMVPSAAAQAWRLSTKDGAWSVLLSSTHVTLEASAPQYTNYSEFKRRFERVWAATLKTVSPGLRTQIGLRYINHLVRDVKSPSEWAKWIEPELLGVLASPIWNGGLQQGVSHLVIETADGTLSVKHGIVRAGPQNELGYLLDYDYIDPTVTEEMSVTSVLERFDTFHDAVYRLFRWSVTELAQSEFGPKVLAS